MEKLEDALKYQAWRAALAHNQAQVHQLQELHTVRKPGGQVLFSLLHIQATAAEGVGIPGVVLLRGHFVSVLTVLIDSASGQRWLLLVRQPRVATGGWFYEHPAGMCDSDTDPLQVALKEVAEETGLHLAAHQLHRLNDHPLYSSPGLLDEAGYFYYCELEMSADQIAALHDKQTGAADEHEQIRLAVVSIDEAAALTRNVNALLHIFMYKQHKGLV